MSLAARRLCWSVVTCSGRLLKHQPRHPKPLRQLWSSRYSVSLQAPLAMGSPDADRAKAKAVLGTTLPQLEEDLADWLVDDVLDSAAWSGPPEVLQTAIQQYLLDWGLCSTELQASLICEDLHASFASPGPRVEHVAARLQQGSSLEAAATDDGGPDSEQEAQQPGTCQLCARDWMPLTEHHLWPRDVHKKYIKRHLMTQADRLQKIHICRQCHTHVHRTFDNETLANDFHSLDSLLQHDAIQRWISYARKQKPRAGVQHGMRLAR